MLARRARPLRFADVAGQDHVVRILQNAGRAGRLGHAFLFHGVRGVGKTTLARILARAVNCTDPSARETFEPCNRCPTCEAILADRHMDVIEMDAASHTGVDDIRPLVESAVYRPQSALCKVYIIDEVHMLSKSAFNALLKTLEEPPPHVRFIFATTEIRRLPATVVSRCLRFDLRPLPADVLVSYFKTLLGREKTGVAVEDEALHLVACASEGSVRDGLSVLDQLVSAGDSLVTARNVRHVLGLSSTEDTFRLVAALTGGPWPEVSAVLDDMTASGADPVPVMQDLLTTVYALTRHRMLKDRSAGSAGTPMPAMPALLVPAELLAQWAGSVSLAWLMRVWQILLKGLDDMKTAPRARDVLEMTLALCVLVREGQGAASGAVVASPAPAAPPSVPPAEAAVQTTGDLPPSFAAMVRLFEENREMVLAMHLRQSVELVAYEPGSVTLFLKAEAPQDLVVRAARLLQIWTGYAWSLTPSRTRGQSSLLEQQQHTTAHARQDALAQPLPQAIANAFPEAQPLWEDMR